MMDAFASAAGVDMSDGARATSFAGHLARCGGDPSAHPAYSWLVTALAEIISEVCDALGVGVEVLTDPTMLVQLPDSNCCHGICGSKLDLDAVVSGLFGVSSPPSPEVALRRVEKTKFEKYKEG